MDGNFHCIVPFSLLLRAISGRGRAHLWTVISVTLQLSVRNVPVVYSKSVPEQLPRISSWEVGTVPFGLYINFLLTTTTKILKVDTVWWMEPTDQEVLHADMKLHCGLTEHLVT